MTPQRRVKLFEDTQRRRIPQREIAVVAVVAMGLLVAVDTAVSSLVQDARM